MPSPMAFLLTRLCEARRDKDLCKELMYQWDFYSRASARRDGLQIPLQNAPLKFLLTRLCEARRSIDVRIGLVA